MARNNQRAAPKADAPKADAPKADAPKADAPKAEASKAKAQKAEAPKVEASATHEIVRPITGLPFKAGDKVDASLWKNAGKLVRLRYLRKLAIDSDVDVAALNKRVEDLVTENRDLVAQNHGLRGQVEEFTKELKAKAEAKA